MKTTEVVAWVVVSGLFFATNCLSAWNYFRGIK
jgi:hypothetical protein